ncbi:type VI secretion system baseplate subunit TssG [Mesobaculum littorinae]|uniref:Type VI secretion system baseplate subunit TssG n=1 Tax=Mesobaculum littorinae TaxID=2486419 RepID=A0A438AHY4_9RHOB|nr:type VI secretion system baseplate subunit TssG [Mesobaculum littorinae]RVV98302.1 type VI secretion system baseplate subunit TssG [Mesobaculum littorinae]
MTGSADPRLASGAATPGGTPQDAGAMRPVEACAGPAGPHPATGPAGYADAGAIVALRAAPDRFDAATGLRVAQAHAARTGRPLLIVSPPDNRPATAPITAIDDRAEAVVATVPVMGLLGPLSPLPAIYGELAARDRRRRAGGLGAFVDVFTDRLTHLYAAAVEKYDIARQLRWSGPGQAAPRIVSVLRSLVGLGTGGMTTRTPLPEDQTLRFAGLLAQRTRSAAGLQALVAAELGLPVRVVQFHLRWRPLPLEEQTRMDGTARLGRDTGAGSRIPDRSGQVRLVVGPVRYPDFLSLEEGQPRLERLRRLIRFYVGPVLDFDIQLVLDRRDIPRTQLGGDGPAPRLGWNAWARSEPATRDSNEAVIGSARLHRAAPPSEGLA